MKKTTTIIISAIPILSVYASGIPGFSFGDFMLALLFACSFFYKHDMPSSLSKTKAFYLLIFTLSIPIISCFPLLIHDDIVVYDVTIRIIRRCFYYFFVIIVSVHFFDYNLGKKVIFGLGKVGALFIFLQSISYHVFGRVIVGFLPFLKVYHEHYSEIDYQDIYVTAFRPTSFLLEPAHISRFLIIPVVLVLFDKPTKEDFIWIIIISLGIILSTSGIGFGILCIIWSFWMFYYKVKRETRVFNYLALLILLVVLAFFLQSTDSMQLNINRIAGSDLTDVNTAGGARFRSFFEIIKLGTIDKIFGRGFGSTPDTELATWFTGAGYITYGLGLSGFLISLIMFYSLFSLSNSVPQKILLFAFFYFFFVDDSFMSHVSILYFSFVCCDYTARFSSESNNLLEPQHYPEAS